MNNFDEQFPEDLAAIGERLRASRPSASDETIHRAMARGESAPAPRKSSSVLWAKTAPKLRGRARLAVATAASLVAVGGATTGGVIAMSSAGATPSTSALVCPADSIVELNALGVQVCVSLDPLFVGLGIGGHPIFGL